MKLKIVADVVGECWEQVGEADMRHFTHTCWVLHGKPEPGSDAADQLVGELIVKYGWNVKFEATLNNHLEYFFENRDVEGFDPRKRRSGGGRKPEMDENQSQLNAELRNMGCGAGLSVRAVNVIRGAGKEVSESTARRNYKTAFGGESHNQQTEKSGKNDLDSAWCVARLGWCSELNARGIDTAKMTITERGIPSKWIRPSFRMCTLDANQPEIKQQVRVINTMEGILFVDQKHAKCGYGNPGKKQCRCYVDPADHTKPMRKDDGGILVPYSKRVKFKFNKEVRFAFGFCTKWIGPKTGAHIGGYRGFVMEPWEYTGKRMLGPKKFNTHVTAEIRRVKNLMSYKKNQKGAGKWGCDHAENPYLAIHGDQWMKKIKEKLGRGSNAVVCVSDMLDHIKEQGDKLYAGTDFDGKWLLWHDALSQMWCPDGWKYIESIGLADRVVRCHSKKGGLYYAGDRYYLKLPGDGPELMPCDANLFADLVNLVRWNVAATFHLPMYVQDADGNKILNDKKFTMGTPKNLSRVYRETIGTNGPNGALNFPQERIVEDIFRIPLTVETIMEAKGGRVDFSGSRRGRREMKHEPGVRSQRKRMKKNELNIPHLNLHPSALEALNGLIEKYKSGEDPAAGVGGAVVGAIVEEHQEQQAAELGDPEDDDDNEEEKEEEEEEENEGALAEFDDEEEEDDEDGDEDQELEFEHDHPTER